MQRQELRLETISIFFLFKMKRKFEHKIVVSVSRSLQDCRTTPPTHTHTFFPNTERHSCLVNVNFIVRLFNRIDNCGRTKTLEKLMEGLRLLCGDKKACQIKHQLLFHSKEVNNERWWLLMKENSHWYTTNCLCSLRQ